jgi:hypothetical protein
MARWFASHSLIAAALLLAASPSRAADPAPAPIKPLTSRSGGFVIYSPDRTTRSSLATMAEQAVEEWAKIVDSKPTSAAPIIVQDKTRSARPRGASSFVSSVFETEGGGMKVQLDLLDPSALRSGQFQLGVFRILALETMHRKNPPQAGKSYAQPPAWLIEGLGEELRRRGGSVPDGVHAALIRSDRPPSLKEFLAQNPDRLDATSLLLYRAQALALLRALIKSPQSKKQFLEFLQNSSDRPSTPELLVTAFPGAAPDSASLSKLWTLSLARSSMPSRLASLSVSKTNDELSAILAIPQPAEAPESPEGPAILPIAARGKGGPFLMRQCSVELLQLEFRAHPLLRPIVEEYRNIVSLLAVKPKAKVDRRIEDNEKIRTLLVERNKAVADYLNWFEATRIDESETPLTEQARPLEIPPRNDPITLYLDAIEQRGW